MTSWVTRTVAVGLHTRENLLSYLRNQLYVACVMGWPMQPARLGIFLLGLLPLCYTGRQSALQIVDHVDCRFLRKTLVNVKVIPLRDSSRWVLSGMMFMLTLRGTFLPIAYLWLISSSCTIVRIFFYRAVERPLSLPARHYRQLVAPVAVVL